MSNRHFKAILAKNRIAEEVREYLDNKTVSVASLVDALQDIELYMGQGNQPEVLDIIRG